MTHPAAASPERRVQFHDLGLTPYGEAWDLQTKLNEEIKAYKRGGGRPRHYLLFCEHPPVYTLGKSGSEDHLRISDDERSRLAIEYYRINRGGDITYHGPGQIVGYPIFDLDDFFTDVHRYVRSIEEVVIRTLDDFQIKAGRIGEHTGVWVDIPSARPRKICAIGVHLSRWVTMHGFALNINTDLSYFNHIVPCGIDASQKPVTSMAVECGQPVSMDDVRRCLMEHFAAVFDFQFTTDQNILPALETP